MFEELPGFWTNSLAVFNDELCLLNQMLTGVANTETQICHPVQERPEMSGFLELGKLVRHQSVGQVDFHSEIVADLDAVTDDRTGLGPTIEGVW